MVSMWAGGSRVRISGQCDASRARPHEILKYSKCKAVSRYQSDQPAKRGWDGRGEGVPAMFMDRLHIHIVLLLHLTRCK